MFTSRAEYRLVLRADNADQRLTPIGRRIGCVSDRRYRTFERKMRRLEAAREGMAGLRLTPAEGHRLGLEMNQDGVRRNATELLAYPGVTMARLTEIWPELGAVDAATASQLENDARYAGYVARQRQAIASMRREESRALPRDLDYSTLSGLSAELREKLSRVRPETLGQAARVDGMTPAGLALLLAAARRLDERRNGQRRQA